jgi:hypothetical protein
MTKPPVTGRGLAAVQRNEKTLPTVPPAPVNPSDPPTADNRAARVRRWARRSLDELLTPESCGCCPAVDAAAVAIADYWHGCHMDRGLPEREALGRELTAAGWTP